MNYIMVLSLSGSCMYILYLIVKRYCKFKIQEQVYYCLLKLVIFYFLIPLPFLKKVYISLFHLQDVENGYMFSQYYKQEDMLIFVEASKIFMNQTAKVNGYVFGIWLLGVTLVSSYFICCYLKRRRILLKCNFLELKDEEKELFDELVREQEVKAKVQVKVSEMKISPFTIGFLKPVILCSNQSTIKEKQMFLVHELIHIRNKDLFWKFAGLLVIISHWFNPFAWFARKELFRVCEFTCDEKVINNKDESYCKEYAELLIKNALIKKGEILEVSLSKDAKEIEKRVMKILVKEKRKKGFCSVALALGIFFINSLTVFAYEDVEVLRGWNELFYNSDVAFVPDGDISIYSTSILEDYEYIYDFQFVDVEEKVYEINGNVEVRVECTHSYVSGTAQKHEKNSYGGCRVYVYDAERCTKCGNVVVKELLYDISYTKCAH